MIDQLSALRLFVRVARTGSFSRAAREHNITQPTASRAIAALEAEIGAMLFTRTTRALSITDAGCNYLERIEPLLDALDEANHALRGDDQLRGAIRVGVTSSMATRAVIPLLPQFLATHPEVKVELIISDEMQDLVLEGVDVALRFGNLADSTAVARHMVDWSRVVVATPGYADKSGLPGIPAELANHSVIVRHAGKAATWSFSKEGREVSVRVDGPVVTSTNEGALAACLAGLGIVSSTLFSCQQELASGALIRVLPDWEMRPVSIYAVFASGRAAKPAARSFAEFLMRELPVV
jgi:DNA-binding transcriptional LysR family regulator